MDAETAAAIKQLADRIEAARGDMALRVDWIAQRHEHEWRDAAAWRTQWSAELDMLEAQVDILADTLRTLRKQLEGPNNADTR